MQIDGHRTKSNKKIEQDQEAVLENSSYRSIVLAIIGWVAAFLYGAFAGDSIVFFALIIFGCLGFSIFSGIKGLFSHVKKTRIISIIGILISTIYIVFCVSSVIYYLVQFYKS